MTQQMCDDAEAGLEFLPLPIWDMGTVLDSQANKKNIALGMYFYDDKTSIFRVPGKVFEPSTEVAFSGAAPLPINGVVDGSPPPNSVGRCGEDISDQYSPNVHHALHVAGGPFMEWGGGMGRMLKCMNTDSTDSTTAPTTPWLSDINLNKYLCSARKTTIFSIDQSQNSYAACVTNLSQPGAPNPASDLMKTVCPKRDQYRRANSKVDESDDPYLIGMALDLSQWEGIAFWARRSPNSQAGIRLAVADKYVDDDMAYLSQRYDPKRPRYCERKVVCSCNNNKPCTSVKVTDNVFDADGNRAKWATASNGGTVRSRVAVDGPPILSPPMGSTLSDQDIQDIRHNRHSLINMSGEPIVNPKTGKTTFDDNTPVYLYNGPVGGGQPHDTDAMVPHNESFCFDPAVDPVPPDGTHVSRIINRGYQNPRVTAPDPPKYVIDSSTGFFFNTAAPDQNRFDPPGAANALDVFQIPVTDPNHTEMPGYNYTPCGASFCDYEYPSFQAVDKQTFGRGCNAFSFVGSITYKYCYDPGVDPNPAEGSQQCGDYWMKSVNLSTDWELIKIPFSTLVQQGWAKRQYQFDLSSLTDVRLEWDRGWLDVWISDVRFYRTKR